MTLSGEMLESSASKRRFGKAHAILLSLALVAGLSFLYERNIMNNLPEEEPVATVPEIQAQSINPELIKYMIVSCDITDERSVNPRGDRFHIAKLVFPDGAENYLDAVSGTNWVPSIHVDAVVDSRNINEFTILQRRGGFTGLPGINNGDHTTTHLFRQVYSVYSPGDNSRLLITEDIGHKWHRDILGLDHGPYGQDVGKYSCTKEPAE